ncbi:hypothetical protein [Yinghuangia seranimata]|uniref:hypothetical protein n=1 Tax=Yinghuangia seranimata TaxID=408067 RepID=UPI00248C3F82|nr:hypothetical protein [Yinghuangia seranimata]MDI2125215.1 hypothetical protein [Yinghuangia seranimata]
MGWIENTSARWSRALRSSDSEHALTGVDEAVGMLQELRDRTVRKHFAAEPASPRTKWRDRRDRPSLDEALIAELSRHVVIGMMFSDQLLARLETATGRGREELLAEFDSLTDLWTPTEQFHAMRVEIASGCVLLHTLQRGSDADELAKRVGRILDLAEEHAAALAAGNRQDAESDRPESLDG